MQSLLHSPVATEVFVKLGATGSMRVPYYLVSSVELSQAPTSAPGSGAARFSLSFDTSSVAMLDAVVRDAGPRERIPALALVVRKLGVGRRPATTEWAGTFSRASVSYFDEDLSGSPSGRVTLSLVALSKVLTSPNAVRSVGPFPKAAASSRATEVSLRLGSIRSKGSSYYSVSSVQLSQPQPASAGSSAQFTLSFDTSSLVLLDELVRDSAQARQISGLTFVVREPGRVDRRATTEWTRSFSKFRVISFAENLSGTPSGSVTLSLR